MLESYFAREARYKMVNKQNPELYQKLIKSAKEQADYKHDLLKKLSEKK